MLVDNVKFMNIMGPSIGFLIAESSFFPGLQPNEIDITFRNCEFTNVQTDTDGNHAPLFFVENQDVTFENLLFSNVQASDILLCMGSSTCTVTDTCFEDVSFSISLVRRMFGSATLVLSNVSGTNLAVFGDEPVFCAEGGAFDEFAGDGLVDCFDPFDRDTCILGDPLTAAPTAAPTPPSSSMTAFLANGAIVAGMIAWFTKFF